MYYWYINNVDASSGNYSGRRKPIPVGYILYNCINLTFLKYKMINMEDKRVVAGSQGTGRERGFGLAMKGQEEGSLWWWNWIPSRLYPCQYPVFLYRSFVRCYHCRESGKVCRGSLCLISYNFLCIYNDLKMKHLIINNQMEVRGGLALLTTYHVADTWTNAFHTL